MPRRRRYTLKSKEAFGEITGNLSNGDTPPPPKPNILQQDGPRRHPFSLVYAWRICRAKIERGRIAPGTISRSAAEAIDSQSDRLDGVGNHPPKTGNMNALASRVPGI